MSIPSPLNKGGCPKDRGDNRVKAGMSEGQGGIIVYKKGYPEGTGGILAWMPAPSLASGIYLVRAKIGGNDKGLKPLVTKRIVYLK